MGGVQEGRILLGGGELEDLVPGQYEFPHQVHQLIQQTHINANVAFGKGRGARFRLNLQCLQNGGGLGGALLHKDFPEAAGIPIMLEVQGLLDLLWIRHSGLHQNFAQGQCRADSAIRWAPPGGSAGSSVTSVVRGGARRRDRQGVTGGHEGDLRRGRYRGAASSSHPSASGSAFRSGRCSRLLPLDLCSRY